VRLVSGVLKPELLERRRFAHQAGRPCPDVGLVGPAANLTSNEGNERLRPYHTPDTLLLSSKPA